MEELVSQLARAIALGLDAAAVLIVAVGSMDAFGRIVVALARPSSLPHGAGKVVWRRFGMWLLLALEFELASDIVTSVVAPSWQDLGRLGAIAVIRTFLNYFLEKDVSEAVDVEPRAEPAHL